LALHRIDRRRHPLPGAADPAVAAAALRRRRPELEAPLATQLAASYGTLATEVMTSGPLERLADGVTEVAAQLLYARDREWALTADDVLRRRTTLALTGRDSASVRARIDTLLAS
jgi:glycerol-3-phosphate dehydrogenase